MEIPTDLIPMEPPRTTPVGHRILDAAADLFYRRGITGTGVDLVVERAGTTKRTLYQRFGSKDGLVAAYLRQRAHRWQSHLLDGLRGDDGDALGALYRITAAWAADNPRGCAFVNAWAEAGDGAVGWVAVVQGEKAWMRRLFGLLAADDDLAVALHLLYEGAVVSRGIEGGAAAYVSALDASRRLLRHA